MSSAGRSSSTTCAAGAGHRVPPLVGPIPGEAKGPAPPSGRSRAVGDPRQSPGLPMQVNFPVAGSKAMDHVAPPPSRRLRVPARALDRGAREARRTGGRVTHLDAARRGEWAVGPEEPALGCTGEVRLWTAHDSGLPGGVSRRRRPLLEGSGVQSIRTQRSSRRPWRGQGTTLAGRATGRARPLPAPWRRIPQ